MKNSSDFQVSHGTSLPRWLPGAVLTLVLAIVAGVYAQVCTFEFLPFWDDDQLVHRNPLFSPLSWGSVALFWKAPFLQFYIPVTYTVWAGLVALSRIVAGTSVSFGPFSASLFHGANLLFHLLSVSMVYLILRRLLGGTLKTSGAPEERVLFASALGALVFGLHPVQVEPVAWVTGLRDVMGGSFSLIAIVLFLVWLDHSSPCCGTQRKDWLLYACATVFLALAICSKPGTVVTPALAFLCGLWLLQSKKYSKLSLLYLIPWFIIATTDVILTSRWSPAAELARSLVPLWARPLVACDALAFYLGKIVWPIPPWGLCGDYGRSPNSLFDAGVLWWTWTFPFLLMLVLVFFKSLRAYLMPYALLVIGVLPTLGLMPFNFQVVSTVSDRYLYLAMLGPAFAVGLFLQRSRSRTPWIIVSAFLAVWLILSLLLLPQWKSGNSLFPAILARNPTSWKSRHNYACTLDAQGKLPEALSEFAEAIRLRPSNAEAHNDMALTLLKMGRRQEAIMEFQKSLQIRATPGAARNLAAVFLMNGDAGQAARIYRIAMQIDPSDLQNQRALAWLLATHPDNAVRDGREAVELSRQIVTSTNGQVPLFLLTLAASLAESGDFSNAVTVAEHAGEVYRCSGDPGMAQVIAQRILPALRNRQTIRDDPSRAP